MKSIWFCFILGISYITTHAQNNLIFYGGSGDGYAMSSYVQNSNVFVYNGGAGDGYASDAYNQNANSFVYWGGAGDGFASLSYMQSSNNFICYGGSGDGYATGIYSQAHNPFVYVGGAGDGYASLNTIQLSNDYVYNGGSGDGWSSIVYPIGPLPLTLLSFTGERLADGAHLLQWETEQEINTSHFIVEVSTDAQHFKEIAIVGAAGHSSENKHYSFIQKYPYVGNNFYRLKMVDADEKYTYSNVILLKQIDGQQTITLFPNPAADKIFIRMIAEHAQPRIEMIDVQGKVIYTQTLSEQQTLHEVPIQSLAVGMYHLRIIDGEHIQVIKFSKN